MIVPQFSSPAKAVSSPDSSCNPHRRGACLDQWESKLLTAGLGKPDGNKSGSGNCPPEVPGYECIGRLGSGASGEVWLAEDLQTGRQVALKIMHRMATDTASGGLFCREFRVLARMRHPNLVTLHHAVVTGDGLQCLAMEWVDGLPLDSWLENAGLTLESKLRLFRSIVAGVAYLHEHGVIHRDLKPANVIVDPTGEPRIVDFGLARMHDDGTAEAPGARSIGAAGTLHFMAPEQAADGTGSRAMPVDVFALGAMLYRLLVGEWLRPPDRTSAEILAQVLSPPPLRLPESAKRLPADLLAILHRTLAVDPSRRYLHAGDLGADLDRFAQKLPVTARRPTCLYLTTTFLRRQARRSALAAVLVIAGLTVSGIIHHRQRAIAAHNEANVRHAYALASFTIQQLGEELANAGLEGAPIPQLPVNLQPDPDGPVLPLTGDGNLDLRYFHARLAALRSAVLEGRSQHGPALVAIGNALDLHCELVREAPEDPLRLLDAARTRVAFARLLGRTGRHDAAAEESRKVIRQLERIEGRPELSAEDLLPLRWDATRHLAFQALKSGNRGTAFDLTLGKVQSCKNSPMVMTISPEDGVSPRLSIAADDLASCARDGDPRRLALARETIADLSAVLRTRHEQDPGSFSLACGLARCLHAAARINLAEGNHDALHDRLREAASLLIDRPAVTKHLASDMIWQISQTATGWAEKLIDHPDPEAPKAAITLALRFTAHLRRNGKENPEVLTQRARIFWYQSRLACRLGDRREAARFITKALDILRFRHFIDKERPALMLLTARVMHNARGLADLPETAWHTEQDQDLRRILDVLQATQDQLSPEDRTELSSLLEELAVTVPAAQR